MGKELSSFFRWVMEYAHVLDSLVRLFFDETGYDPPYDQQVLSFDTWFDSNNGYEHLQLLTDAYMPRLLIDRLEFMHYLVKCGATVAAGVRGEGLYSDLNSALKDTLHHTLYKYAYVYAQRIYQTGARSPGWRVSPEVTPTQWWFGEVYTTCFSLASSGRFTWRKTNTGYMVNYVSIELYIDGTVVEDTPTALVHLTRDDVVVISAKRIKLRRDRESATADPSILQTVFSMFEEKGWIAPVDPDEFDVFKNQYGLTDLLPRPSS